jgi:hypothetical protein
MQEIADSKLIDTWGSSGLKVEPDISKILEGWQLGEQPPHEWMNWLQNTFGSKINHILKNGIAKWDDETEYLAGATVQHSGTVWKSLATNTNSEPTDLNANWDTLGGDFGSSIHDADEKITLVNDDEFALIDSEDAFSLKKVTFETIKNNVTLPIASTAEAQSGIDNTKAITPLRLREGLNASGTAPIFACRGWAYFDGTKDTTGATSTANTNRLILGSGNITSILRNALGDFTPTFTTAMPDTNYVVLGTQGRADTATTAAQVKSLATGSFNFQVRVGSSNGLIDNIFIFIAVFR